MNKKFRKKKALKFVKLKKKGEKKNKETTYLYSPTLGAGLKYPC